MSLCPCIMPIAIAKNGSFLYRSILSTNYMEGYSVDAATGVLSALTGSPFKSPGADSIAIDPSSSYLYVSDDTDLALLAYSINSTTGALTPISGSPYATGGSVNCSGCGLLPTSVSVDSSGKYVYVQSEYTSSSSIITAFSINPANGSLTAVPGSPFTVGSNPTGLIGIAFAPIP
jgi:6-phosphogluconolactonase